MQRDSTHQNIELGMKYILVKATFSSFQWLLLIVLKSRGACECNWVQGVSTHQNIELCAKYILVKATFPSFQWSLLRVLKNRGVQLVAGGLYTPKYWTWCKVHFSKSHVFIISVIVTKSSKEQGCNWLQGASALSNIELGIKYILVKATFSSFQDLIY